MQNNKDFKSSKDNIIKSDKTQDKDKKDIIVDYIPTTDFILLPKFGNKNKINNYKIICNDLLNLIVPIFIIVCVLSIVIYIIYII